MISLKNLKMKKKKDIFCSKMDMIKLKILLEEKTNRKFIEFAKAKRSQSIFKKLLDSLNTLLYNNSKIN